MTMKGKKITNSFHKPQRVSEAARRDGLAREARMASSERKR